MTDQISSKSAYDAIAEVILGRIASGEYPGPSLPTENQLSIEFGVSRVTVNRALLELANMGVVEVRRGTGTYLADPVRIHSGGLVALLRAQLRDGDMLLLRDPRGGTRRLFVTDLED